MSEIPRKFASEYAFAVHQGNDITLSRRDNHGRLLPDGKWAACWLRGSGNPWYLNVDGSWKYKRGCTYKTAEDAYSHCLQFPPPSEIKPQQPPRGGEVKG